MTALLNQATMLHSQGRLVEAEAMYRSVLAADPLQPDALALLGVLLAGRKEFSEAVALLNRAIQCDPATPLFRFYLGNVFLDSGEDARAAEAYREALALQPDFVEAHFKLALIFEKQNRFSEAAQHLQHIVRAKLDYGGAWVKLSDIAIKNCDYALAGRAAETAVRLMPDNLAARVAYALALDFLDREEDALEALRHAIRIKPDFIEAQDMLGLTYRHLGRLDEAEAVMRKLIESAGVGIADETCREVHEEEYSIQHWNLALIELLRGDLVHGFAHYRARFKNPGRSPRLDFPRPIWRGEALRGKRILLVGEQGFGDVFMLCRYAPLLKAKGARVVLLVHPALVSYLTLAKLADEILCEAPQAQGAFDFQTSLFDAPYYLGTTLDTIPADSSYLPLPPVEAAFVLPDTGRPKIGVVWSGRRDFGNDRRRSLPLSIFAALFGEPDAAFFNLTRELNEGDAKVLAQHAVVDLSAALNDFLTTAQFIAQLDLVITCDTALAHLAGGMGKKVWVLLPFDPDWRWLTEREDSPWYPTMRLFRQSKKADWAGVVTRVRKELALFLQCI